MEKEGKVLPFVPTWGIIRSPHEIKEIRTYGRVVFVEAEELKHLKQPIAVINSLTDEIELVVTFNMVEKIKCAARWNTLRCLHKYKQNYDSVPYPEVWVWWIHSFAVCPEKVKVTKWIDLPDVRRILGWSFPEK